MHFVNNLSDDDMQRAHDSCPDPPPPTLMAGSYCCLLEAVDIYTQEFVHPVTSGMLALTDREKVILGLYYRSMGFCRSAIKLDSVVHQQSLTSAERSVIELYIDMELIHRDAIEHAMEKFNVFTEWQKLKAARRIDQFFTANPDLDSNPSKATVHRQFMTTQTALIEEKMEALWGLNDRGSLIKPEHWSALNLIDRSQKLDKDAEYLVIKDYDRRNFSIHTGLAGVYNLNQAAFEAMCAFALNLIGDCMLAELKILGKELKLDVAIPNFKQILEKISNVQVYAFADKILQSIGEPSRYTVNKGDPPLVHIA